MAAYDANLIAYWPLDEASGDRIDLVGAYTATDTNTVGSTTGKHYNAASFASATTEYLSAAHAAVDLAAVFASEVFTIAFWFKLANETVDRGLWGMTDTTNGVQMWYRRSNEGTNPRKIQVRSFNGGATTANFVSSSNWDDGNWHQACLVANGSGSSDWTLYVDAGSQGTGGGLVGDGGGAFAMGRDYNTYYNNNPMDEVAIWNTALSASAVTALYNSGTGSYYRSTEVLNDGVIALNDGVPVTNR